MSLQTIDINADAGESFGRWTLGADHELLPLVTTVNVACGFHAGDPSNMRRSLILARECGISVGAHPGYPDLLGFGRRRLAVSEDDVVDYILYQTGALLGIAATEGVRLTHVKPHGSLYGQVADSAELAVRVASSLQVLQDGLSLMISPGVGASAVREARLPVVLDAAVDLEYDDNGKNIIEPLPGVKDPGLVADRALGLAHGYVVTTSGRRVPLEPESLCVHGDRPNAPDIARAVRAPSRERRPLDPVDVQRRRRARWGGSPRMTEMRDGSRFSFGADEFVFVELSEEMSLEITLRVIAITDELRRKAVPGIVDICPAHASYMLRVSPEQLDPRGMPLLLEDLHEECGNSSHLAIHARLIEMPILYDDPWTHETLMKFRDRHQAPTMSDLQYCAQVNGFDDVAGFIKAHSSEPLHRHVHRVHAR